MAPARTRARRMCFDRILPLEPQRAQRTLTDAAGRARGLAPRKSKWVNGSEIKIRFLEGTQQQIDMVKQIAPEWTQYANLSFAFTDDPSAQIRVSFDANDGAWSYIGTDNMSIPKNVATLNLGWQDEGVILHEFGHMIGLAHEHSSPMGGIVWNEEEVIRDLQGPPNFWDIPTIRFNVFQKYSVDQIFGTQFDPDSIMLYAFPDDWTKNMGATHENQQLSTMDKDFVRSSIMYPGAASPNDKAVKLEIGKSVSATLGTHDEEDLYRFEVPQRGRFVIETTGSTDVVIALFGPDDPTRLIARDDDGGAGVNARIVALLDQGAYFVQVRHYWPDGTGAYGISARSA